MRTEGDRASQAGRIAAQLAREPGADKLTCDMIGADAAAIYAAACDMRDALEKKDRAAYRRAANAIRRRAGKYGAELVSNGDAPGMVAGLKLAGRAHSSGHKDWFFLA